MLVAGDLVIIRLPEREEESCHYCDVDVGIDDYMFNYEGDEIEVESMNRLYKPACGAQVFEADDYLWTTCWVEQQPMIQTWEV